MKHEVNIYFDGPQYYSVCVTCGWRSAMVQTPYDADHARVIHKTKVAFNFRHFWMLLKAYRYGYKPCPCQVGCESCAGFGFIPTKGVLKFSKDFNV